MAEPVYSDTGCTGSTPLVLGAARGMRTFYLDEDGWLRGVTYRAPWRDGENLAKCYVARPLHAMVKTTRAFLGARPAPYTMGGVVFDADPDVPPVPEEGHELVPCKGMEPGCGCGFYAYHTGDVRYATNGPGCRVVGVVEAYGKLILGTTGFRAEKARILGVVVPSISEGMRTRAAMDRTAQDVKDAMAELAYQASRRWWRHPMVAAYAATAAVVAAGSVLVPGGWPGLLVAGFAAANARITYVVAANRTVHLLNVLAQDLKEVNEARAVLPLDYSAHIERARAHYPGIQFFESEEEMRQAFPVESMAALAREHRMKQEDPDVPF